DKGKIGLSISPADSSVIYATIELAQRTGGLWRSTDAGESWEKRSDEVYSGTGPHYYQEIFASPHDVDTLYQVAPTLYKTVDGGKTMQAVRNRSVHGDYHAVVFDPQNPDYLMVGTDGGVYESFDEAAHWRFFANMPITQFYKVTVDYDEPFYNIYGGTQDNNTQGGPSRTDNVHGIRNSDWFVTVFADGHQPAADPTNPDIVYSEWQEGNLVRFDRKTGEIVYIQPQPEADEESDRFNWDAPILISPHDSKRLYFASQRVWRSDNRGDSWQAISGDLSHGRDRMQLPMMGRVWSYDSAWDLMAMSQYGTITSLSESPIVEGLLYAGTDDGRIQVSEDGGGKWRAIDRLPNVPEGFFVNDIKADLHDADTVYVVVDDHKSGDFAPYILKSTNRGKSWKSISQGLPERHVAWRLVQDHVNPDLLFAATEFGVFFTVGSGTWTKLSGGAPTIAFRDLAIQKRENDLVGATFGRSFYVLDDYTPLRDLTPAKLRSETMLFPVRDALWYVQRMPLGEFRTGSKSSQGDSYFVADNPPFGAVITYYLPESLLTAKEQRREKEKKIEKQAGDTPYPGWDALRAEKVEEDPAVLLAIRDSNGNVVRKLEGPAKAGFHRVAWDLRYPDSSPWTDQPQDNYIVFNGPLAAPGDYTVSLATRVNGVLKETGQQTGIKVNMMRQNSLASADPAKVVAFSLRLDKLIREGSGANAAMKALLTELGAIKQTLLRSGTEGELRATARGLELEVMDLQLKLSGDPARDLAGDPGPVSVNRRVNV
ncbi:MAG: glycosyl hydrolase, partial [Gammaproteobacteria bacterium]|nr:glycosyl hydrolase [Gammaproteobacteria bacterium]